MAQHFSAKVYKLGINPCVDVPQRVSQAFDQRGYVPVTGTLNGHVIRATLAPHRSPAEGIRFGAPEKQEG
jgi:hypothetical protein